MMDSYKLDNYEGGDGASDGKQKRRKMLEIDQAFEVSGTHDSLSVIRKSSNIEKKFPSIK